MRENKQLSARVAMAVAVATLVGASAFAESRPSEGTRSRGDARSTVRRGTVSARGESGRGNESRNRATVDSRSSRSTERADRSERRSTERRVAPGTTRSRDTQTQERRSTGRTEARSERRTEGRTYERRSDGRSGNRGNGTYRGNGRNDNRGNGTYNRGNGNRGNGTYNRGNRGNGSYNRGNRTPYYHRGRVSNYTRYGGGYRVWIVGSPYPFYVPLAYWHADRFRIGLTIGLGGYYNDLGYYDYYDGYRDGVRDRSYNDNNLHSEADFRGVVESVDWRRDTFVVRNEATGSFVTVVLRDRREDSVRAGDFVAVRGDWTTRGVFHAYDVDILD